MASKIVKEAMDEEVKLEMTPMIDVVFLLLIFFIVTMKFRIEEGKLEAKLPEDMGQNAGGAPVDREKVRIRINLKDCNIKDLIELNFKRMSVEQYFKEHGSSGKVYVPTSTDFDIVLSVGNTPTMKLKQITTLGAKGQPESKLTMFSMSGAEQKDTTILITALKKALEGFPASDRDLTPLIIDPDRSATYLALTVALHAADKAGFKTIQFAGKIGSH